MEETLKEIENWLNSQERIDKTEVIMYNEHIALSFWSCGAIVCIYDRIRFIHEDDDVWYACDGGMQCGFSIGWADSFIDAMNRLKTFVKANGRPIYRHGTNTISHYAL